MISSYLAYRDDNFGSSETLKVGQKEDFNGLEDIRETFLQFDVDHLPTDFIIFLKPPTMRLRYLLTNKIIRKELIVFLENYPY